MDVLRGHSGSGDGHPNLKAANEREGGGSDGLDRCGMDGWMDAYSAVHWHHDDGRYADTYGMRRGHGAEALADTGPP